MTMRFTYRLHPEKNGFLASCVESDALGEGPSEQAAVASLREALEERMFRPDAVAPPSRQPDESIELVRADEPKAEQVIEPSGPGEAVDSAQRRRHSMR